MTAAAHHSSTLLSDIRENNPTRDVLELSDLFGSSDGNGQNGVILEAASDISAGNNMVVEELQHATFQGNFTLQTNATNVLSSASLEEENPTMTALLTAESLGQTTHPVARKRGDAASSSAQLALDIKVMNAPAFDPYEFSDDDTPSCTSMDSGRQSSARSVYSVTSPADDVIYPVQQSAEVTSHYRIVTDHLPSTHVCDTPQNAPCNTKPRFLHMTSQQQHPILSRPNMLWDVQPRSQHQPPSSDGPMRNKQRQFQLLPPPTVLQGVQVKPLQKQQLLLQNTLSQPVHPSSMTKLPSGDVTGSNAATKTTLSHQTTSVTSTAAKPHCRKALLDVIKARVQPKVPSSAPQQQQSVLQPPQQLPEPTLHHAVTDAHPQTNSVKLDLKAYVQNKIQMLKNETLQSQPTAAAATRSRWTECSSGREYVPNRTALGLKGNNQTASSCHATLRKSLPPQPGSTEPQPRHHGSSIGGIPTLPKGAQLAQERVRLSSPEEVPKCTCKTERSLVAKRCVLKRFDTLAKRAKQAKAVLYLNGFKRVLKLQILQILRRSGHDEKVLVVVRARPGHVCATAILVVGVVLWDGVRSHLADQLYTYLSGTLSTVGLPTERRCATNEQRSCACQGSDDVTSGASFSFGCSWSMYYNGCKFSRSKVRPRKFKLRALKEEDELRDNIHRLSDELAPHCARLVPAAFHAMCLYDDSASDCRLGTLPGRPWSGVTVCSDFSEHPHKDSHNMSRGCSAIVSFCKQHSDCSGDGADDKDEQLHVMPLCVLDPNCGDDEAPSIEERIRLGAVEQLTSYPVVERVRNTPLLSKRKRIEARRKQMSTDGAGAGGGGGKKKAKLELRRSGSDVSIASEDTASSSVASAAVTADAVTAAQRRILSRGPDGRFMSKTPEPLVKTETESSAFPQPPSYEQAISNRLLEAGDVFQPQNEPQQHYKYNEIDTILHGLNGLPNSVDNDMVECKVDLIPVTSMDQLIHNEEYNNTHHSFPIKCESRSTEASSQDPQQKAANMEVNSGLDDILEELDLESTLSILDNMSKSDDAKTTPSDAAADTESQHKLPPFDEIFGDFSPNPLLSPRSDAADSVARSSEHYFMDSEEVRSQLEEIENGAGAPIAAASDVTAAANQTPSIRDVFSDNSAVFGDPQCGGVAIALKHGSILFEVAKKEVRSSTALRHPNRLSPSRLALTFYQHKSLNAPRHGFSQYQRKAEKPKSARGSSMQQPPVFDLEETARGFCDSVQRTLKRLMKPDVQVPQQVRTKMEEDSTKRSYLDSLRSTANISRSHSMSTNQSSLHFVPVHQTPTKTTLTLSQKLCNPQTVLSGPYVQLDDHSRT